MLRLTLQGLPSQRHRAFLRAFEVCVRTSLLREDYRRDRQKVAPPQRVDESAAPPGGTIFVELASTL